MKNVLLFLIVLLIGQMSNAQEKARSELLIVKLYENYDKVNKRNYFFLETDAGVDGTTSMKQLKSIDLLYPHDDDPDYYKKRKRNFSSINKDSIIYNYFISESQALNYVISKGWSVFTVLQEVKRNPDLDNYAFSISKYLFIKTAE